MEITGQTIQITTGTAAFILMTPTQTKAASIPVTRRSRQWKPFAGRSTIALQEFADRKAQAWTLYRERLPFGYRDWYFNLCGKVSFNSDYSGQEYVLIGAPAQETRRAHWDLVFYPAGVHEV